MSLDVNKTQFDGVYGVGLDAASNPNPNTLGVVSPYPSPIINIVTPSAAWVAQGRLALVPKGVAEADEDSRNQRYWLGFDPQGGAAITYDVDIWVFNRTTGTWMQPVTAASGSFTGPAMDYIELPPFAPVFIQLSNISAGLIDIQYDSLFLEGI